MAKRRWSRRRRVQMGRNNCRHGDFPSSPPAFKTSSFCGLNLCLDTKITFVQFWATASSFWHFPTIFPHTASGSPTLCGTSCYLSRSFSGTPTHSAWLGGDRPIPTRPQGSLLRGPRCPYIRLGPGTIVPFWGSSFPMPSMVRRQQVVLPH